MKEGLPFHILLADDDSEDRMIIDEAFLEIGYASDVKKFNDAEDLLRYLTQIGPEQMPSLIVLDNTLPKLNATEALKILKKNPVTQSIAVVVYSSKISPSKKAELLSLGAYECLEKAMNMKDVVQLAKQLRNTAEEQKI